MKYLMDFHVLHIEHLHFLSTWWKPQVHIRRKEMDSAGDASFLPAHISPEFLLTDLHATLNQQTSLTSSYWDCVNGKDLWRSKVKIVLLGHLFFQVPLLPSRKC